MGEELRKRLISTLRFIKSDPDLDKTRIIRRTSYFKMIKLDAPEGVSPARMKPGIFCMLGKTTKTSPDIFFDTAPWRAYMQRHHVEECVELWRTHMG